MLRYSDLSRPIYDHLILTSSCRSRLTTNAGPGAAADELVPSEGGEEAGSQHHRNQENAPGHPIDQNDERIDPPPAD